MLDFRVLRENRRVCIDESRARELETFHSALGDVAWGHPTERVKELVVELNKSCVTPYLPLSHFDFFFDVLDNDRSGTIDLDEFLANAPRFARASTSATHRASGFFARSRRCRASPVRGACATAARAGKRWETTSKALRRTDVSSAPTSTTPSGRGSRFGRLRCCGAAPRR